MTQLLMNVVLSEHSALADVCNILNLFLISIHHITVNGSSTSLWFHSVYLNAGCCLISCIMSTRAPSSLVLSLFLSVGSEYVNQSERGPPYVPLLSPAAFFLALTRLLVY